MFERRSFLRAATAVALVCGGTLFFAACSSSTPAAADASDGGSAGSPASSDAQAATDGGDRGDGGDAASQDSGAASCGDTTSSSSNCGACGHDCQGATCAAGRCQPTIYTGSGRVGDFAIDATTVYFVSLGSGAASADQILALPKAGGGAASPRVLATAPAGESLSGAAIAVAGATVVWSVADHLGFRSAPAAGGTVTQLYDDPTRRSVSIRIGQLAAFGSMAYYTEGCGDLYALPLSGGPPVALANNGCNQYDTNGPVIDPAGEYAYLDSPGNGALWRVKLADGSTISYPAFDGSGPIAVGSTSVFWLTDDPSCGALAAPCMGGHLSRAPTAGGAATTIASPLAGAAPGGGHTGVAALVANAKAAVYSTLYSPAEYNYMNAVVEVPLGGGTPFVLWSGDGGDEYFGTRLRIDDKAAYALSGDGVMRLPL